MTEHDVDRWQWINREQLACDLGAYLPARAMDELVHDYLDHHGGLARLFADFADPVIDDPEVAPMIREELHRHLLAVGLLAEWCEALEYRQSRAREERPSRARPA